MFLAARRFLLFAHCFALPGALLAQKKSALEQSGDLEHVREELGVNEFTAPSIDLIFDQLESLKPIPFDKAWRDLPEATPQDRARLALSAGQVIADGFLAVSAHKQSRIEPVGRILLKLARGLGVGDPISKHSKSLIELAAKEKWPEIKRELIRTQGEVEAGMMALKDEEIAHLVSLGGWIRGLEMTASIAIEGYTPERARSVIQPELFDYFCDRLETLNPNLKKTDLFMTIIRNLGTVRALTRKPVETPIELGDLKKIRDLSREINKLIAE
ncbi:MAG: hypothetical protein JWL59_1901 [Chthoniobacteraceae bacterium]|nr:hypothetical protein [Chthoniobacteraceae bacterium]